MEDQRIERLSRFIDGDLPPAEEQDLRAQLESDPALAADLGALIEVRRSLSALATRESAPADLDALVEPLLRGRPEPIAVRPWARWLASAAVVVLSLTVGFEVYRGHRRPDIEDAVARRYPQPALEPTERFALAPLPTSSVPPEEQLIGVGDRLLASPIPDVEVDNPPALEVLGPLEQEVGETLPPSSDTVLGGGTRRRAEMPEASADRGDESTARTAPPAPGPNFEDAVAKKDAKSNDAPNRGAMGSEHRSWRDHTTAGRGQLFIFVGEKSVWRDFETEAFCTPGRYAIRIKVGAGVVTEVWSVGIATTDKTSQRLCAGQLVMGLTVAGVPDGEYAAEVEVEPRGAGT